MKYYVKTKLFGAGHPQLPEVFSTKFSKKCYETEFWQNHETTHAKFNRFYLKELKGDFLKKIKSITGHATKVDLIIDLNNFPFEE